MSRLTADADFRRDVDRLGPYARYAVERAAAYALHMHAEELAPEHLLASLLEDEECAATRIVLHAFADPETIGIEVLALCPGIMVVQSERCLPFSPRAVAALEEARAAAAAHGAQGVSTGHVLAAALAELSDEAREALRTGGLEPTPPAAAVPATGAPVPAEGPLFQRFSNTALRSLGAACRTAGRLGRDSISPAHLMLAALEVDGELRADTGLTAARLRLALGGRDADASPLKVQELPPEEQLVALLARLPDGAGTAEILGGFLSEGSDEVRALLSRQKITLQLYEHARGAFDDPAPPA